MKKDLRVQKTLQSIDDAIIRLLKEKPFENITIKDISDEAMINRGTFYSHYSDKYELIESFQVALVSDIEELLYGNIVGESFSEIAESQVKETIVKVFEYLEENRIRVLTVANSVGTTEFAKYFSRHMYNFYKVKSEEFGVDLNSEGFTDYLITYVTNAHMGIFLKWLKNDCQESTEEMAGLIETFTINGVFKAIDI
ncbi:TetR/AcrR family transcriptional regulator [Salinicoccus siamensis]|uniref:TetR/AcrR family transcriptional regulator n=1 Tax=Salinicoccus siamensis TaxID=381830 RepID=A0ABV5Z2Y9_9STAP